LTGALAAAPLAPRKPTAIICNTIKGKGVSFTEGNLSWHHRTRVSGTEAASLLAAIETE
jgi:transketolase